MESSVANGEMYMSEEVTVLISSSYIPSHPSVKVIEETLSSLEQTDMGHDYPVLVVHDGLKRGAQQQEKEDYRIFLRSFSEKFADHSKIRSLELAFHGHLAGAISEALKEITTEFVLVVQHDLPFVKPVPIRRLARLMRTQPQIRHLRFNSSAVTNSGWDALYEDKHVRRSRSSFLRNFEFEDRWGKLRLVSTLAWSDQNYLVSREHLVHDLVPIFRGLKTFPENVLNPLLNEETHRYFGTFLFGGMDDPAYILHRDGRSLGLEPRSKRKKRLTELRSRALDLVTREKARRRFNAKWDEFLSADQVNL